MAESLHHDKQVVVFSLAQERYGVDIASVQEIIPWTPVTRIPQAQASIEGIINLRGSIIPVVDLRKLFQLPSEIGRETRVVVVEIGDFVAGLVVDAVSEVLLLSTGAISAAPAVALGANHDFIAGVAKEANQLIILLDVEHLLGATDESGIMAQFNVA